MGRRRVRRFIARDSHGRFARTNSLYKKKLSTRKKVAIGAAGAVVVTGAALGGRELYRSGARKGWEVGKRHGVAAATPPRDARGRVRKRNPRVDSDYSQNPFARGYRPVGVNSRARRPPRMRTAGSRVRQITRIRERQFLGDDRRGRSEFRHQRRVRQARERIGRSRAASTARLAARNARRYNQAQSRSQRVVGSVRTGVNNARVAGRRIQNRNAFIGSSSGVSVPARRRRRR